MKRIAFALVATLSLNGGTVVAQSAVMRWSANGGVFETHFDGRTIVSDDTVVWRYWANVEDLDLANARIVQGDLSAYVSFRCKSHQPRCVSAQRRGFGPSDSRFESIEAHCHRAEECQAFLDRVRGATDPRGTGTRGPAAAVDCNALRATYGRAGQRPTLPPECLTELDRATTYEPVNPLPTASPPPRPPETVIDGSKIPSRIDFPGRSVPPSAPQAPPPSIVPTTPEAQTRTFEELLSQPPKPRPYVAAPMAVNPSVPYPIYGESIAEDLADIEAAVDPSNVILKNPFQYAVEILEVICEKIDKVFADVLR